MVADARGQSDELRTLNLRAGDIMQQEPSTIAANAPVLSAAKAMDRHGLPCLLDEDNGKIVGIVTERDIVRRVAATDLPVRRTPVEAIMSSPIITVSPDATIEETLKIMANNRVRRLPVVDKTRLLGLVTLVDVAKALAVKEGNESALIGAIVRQTDAPEGVNE